MNCLFLQIYRSYSLGRIRPDRMIGRPVHLRHFHRYRLNDFGIRALPDAVQ